MAEGNGGMAAEEAAHPLEKYLIEKGLVNEDMLYAARREQGVTHDDIGSILIRNGFIRQEDYVQAVLSVSPDDLVDEQVFVSTIPPKVLIDTHTMIIAETEDLLYVSTLSPEIMVEEQILRYDPREVRFVGCSPDRLERYLDDLVRLSQDDEESLLDRLVREALMGGVSDIHVKPRERSYTVMFRFLGVRKIVHEGTLDEYHTLSARIKDRAHMDLSERRQPQDGGFQVEYRRKMVDMRVATLPVVDGEEIVIRLLDPDAVNPKIEKLGITRLDEWRRGFGRPDGLCLVCGPTGSGKTTTLNGTVRELDRFGRSIFSVEDPVEYRVPYIAQVATNPAVGLDFARAIKSFMRTDPDIMVLGEVRDEDTARNLIKGAETGHMVLATLHTGSIHGAVDRLRDIGVKDNDLVYLLRAVLVQRLVRTICGKCDGAGCKSCMGTGYGGRTVVSECAYFHDEHDVRQLIQGERWWPRLPEDAMLKFQEGMTTRKEIERVFAGEIEPYLQEFDKQAAEQARPDSTHTE